MILRSLAACALLAVPAMAQPRGITMDRLWFADGTALGFSTHSTGSTSSISSAGSMVVSAFVGAHRLVVDKNDNLIFVYGVEAWRAAAPQTFFVRIKPVDRGFEAGDPDDFLAKRYPNAPRPLPTVAAVREFPMVKLGESILLDILQNPTTGEKIYDVISPGEAFPQPVARAQSPDEFSVEHPRIVVNGQTMMLTGSGAASGGALCIHLPAKGSYYLSTEPSARYTFQPAGRVERDRLTIDLNNDRIELSAKGNILKDSAYRTVWVYYDPGQDSKYLNLNRQIDKLRISLDGMRAIYTPQHPTMRSTAAALDLLEHKQNELGRTVSLESAAAVETLFRGAK